MDAVDNEDTDDDNDGLSDQDENVAGTDPFDVDGDDDGVWDDQDVFPTDPTEWKDSDGDGYGDNSDEFPYDDTEWKDSTITIVLVIIPMHSPMTHLSGKILTPMESATIQMIVLIQFWDLIFP